MEKGKFKKYHKNLNMLSRPFSSCVQVFAICAARLKPASLRARIHGGKQQAAPRCSACHDQLK
jgi:hypothetical protein